MSGSDDGAASGIGAGPAGGTTNGARATASPAAAPVIELRGVAKRYPANRRRLFEKVRHRFVLEDIDFAVREGEAWGILGSNGAGKSTLLKIIAGVLRPTHGTAIVRAPFGALIELGAGFHGEQNAVPNLQAAALLMGVGRDRLAEVVDAALAFSELGEHLDKPLKYLSSGMVARLGFALVAAVRPPILITDEVLAVGDESFQKKCVQWLESYLSGGGTLLLVSHNLYHVQKLCANALWLRRGRVQAVGECFEVVQAYLAHHEAKLGASETEATRRTPVDLALPGADQGRVARGHDERLHVAAACDEVRICLRRLSGEAIWSADLSLARGEADLMLPTGCLLPGRYLAEGLVDQRLCARLQFQVTGPSREFGTVYLPHGWG